MTGRCAAPRPGGRARIPVGSADISIPRSTGPGDRPPRARPLRLAGGPPESPTSQDDRSRSPDVRSRSPGVRSRLSFERKRSPALRSTSPALRSRLSFERERSPPLRSTPPSDRSTSPGVRSRRPFERKRSPPLRSTSPGVRSTSPGAYLHPHFFNLPSKICQTCLLTTCAWLLSVHGNRPRRISSRCEARAHRLRRRVRLG